MLSVITVSLNAEAEIGRTLSSLASQTVHPFEHLVVDGGSTDATPNIVKQRSLPFTRLIQQVDCGPYDAMNKATLHARGKYAMFLNAGDTFAAPTVLSHLERAMHEGKEIMLAIIIITIAESICTKSASRPPLRFESSLRAPFR